MIEMCAYHWPVLAVIYCAVVTAEATPIITSSIRRPWRSSPCAHIRTMAPGILDRAAAANAQQAEGGAAKRRRVSSKAVVDGLANSFTSTVDKDIDYATQKLRESTHLVGWLASQLRDGTLEQAWRRTQTKESHEWAPSSVNMRHVGSKLTKDFVAKVAPPLQEREVGGGERLHVGDPGLALPHLLLERQRVVLPPGHGHRAELRHLREALR